MEKRNISETPDKWVLLKLSSGYYKVFGTWAGGYLDGDRWKLNSGIKSVEHDDEFYYFIGFSGSIYKCHKKSYGTASSYGLGILNNILETANGEVTIVSFDEHEKAITELEIL